MAKDKLLAPSHPWVQACCHLLQSLGVIILVDQSIIYYMLAASASPGHDFLCLLKLRDSREEIQYISQQAGNAAISIVQREIKNSISVGRKQARCPSKVYFVEGRTIFVFSLHFKLSLTENKVLFSEDRCAGIC